MLVVLFLEIIFDIILATIVLITDCWLTCLPIHLFSLCFFATTLILFEHLIYLESSPDLLHSLCIFGHIWENLSNAVLGRLFNHLDLCSWSGCIVNHSSYPSDLHVAMIVWYSIDSVSFSCANSHPEVHNYKYVLAIGIWCSFTRIGLNPT